VNRFVHTAVQIYRAAPPKPDVPNGMRKALNVQTFESLLRTVTDGFHGLAGSQLALSPPTAMQLQV
jgi:hypothetical protein